MEINELLFDLLGFSGDIPAATAEDVDIAVKAARRALRRDDWGSTTGAQRAKYLRAIAAKVGVFNLVIFRYRY